ncbi:MAG: Rab family GTPase [Promethearchaeota archaeon]
MTTEEREFVFKITILGDAAVGKTSLINQFVEGAFQEDYKPTLGANIVRKDVDLSEINAQVRLIMWDLAGQEKYNVIRSMYFQGVSGCIIVFDLTRMVTFESIETKWLKDFRKYAKRDAAYILIGNKVDLNDERAVPEERGKELAQKIQASDFIETSAKYGDNVEKAFKNLVFQILRNYGEKV